MYCFSANDYAMCVVLKNTIEVQNPKPFQITTQFLGKYPIIYVERLQFLLTV